MRLVVADEVVRKHPGLRIGIVRGKGLDNARGEAAEMTALKRRREGELRERFTVESLGDHPFIRSWQETYRGFGANPKRIRPTAEALCLRTLKGKELPAISPIVDATLLVQLEHLLPWGGYDTDGIDGDIVLRYSGGGEPFTGRDAAAPSDTTKEGEIVYSDARSVLTRYWNAQDGERGKITTATTNVAFFTEAAGPEIPSSAVRECVESLRGYLERFCGGSFATELLDVGTRSSVSLDD